MRIPIDKVQLTLQNEIAREMNKDILFTDKYSKRNAPKFNQEQLIQYSKVDKLSHYIHMPAKCWAVSDYNDLY
jgi:hypothetical protein